MYKYDIPINAKNKVPTTGFLAKSLNDIGNGLVSTFLSAIIN
jgi:hypothetical protein